MTHGDAKPGDLVSSKETAPSITATPSPLQGDSTHSSSSTKHTEPKADLSGILTGKELSQQFSPRNTTDYGQMTVASVQDGSSEHAHEAMIRCHDKLVTAISTDIISVSGTLLAKGFISEEMQSKMLLYTLTSEEKATDLVGAIRKKIKLVPNQFEELMKIFSEQSCTKDVVPFLASHDHREQVIKDRKQDADNIGVIISTDKQIAVSEGHMYMEWESLDQDNKIDLEARLLTDAETMGQDFALLCCKTRDSFAHRGVTPQDLAFVLLDLMVYKPTSGTTIPLLKEKEDILMRAQSVHEIFNALRPHMSFYNYEILQFLIEGKGSEGDKTALAMYLRNFTEFCKRHVFEVPLTTFSNGHQIESHNKKQRLHIKVTEHFKAAFLIQSPSEALSPSSDESRAKSVCSSKLGIKLNDAKGIQRKLAKILGLNPSTLFLDTISEGSVILTFLLPEFVSLAGLDDNPEIVQLSSNGITILCGPPGKLKLIDLTQNGMIIRWSQPEYGCKSLTQYSVYYRKKEESEANEWKKLELSRLETRTCIPDLGHGDTYVFKISTVSESGTLQYGDESGPIVVSSDRILTDNVHKVIVANKAMLTSAFSSADSDIIATVLSVKGVIPKDEAQIILQASTPSEKATLLSTAVEDQIKSSPEKFQEFLSIVQKDDACLPGNMMETLKLLWSDYFNKDIISTPASSLADLDGVVALIKGYSRFLEEEEAQISQASTPSEKATVLKAAIEKKMKHSPREFLYHVQKANLSLPGDILEIFWPTFCKDILTPAFSSADPDTTATVLSLKGVISKEDETQINLASTRSEKATLLMTAVDHQLKRSPEEFQDFLNTLHKASPLLPGDVVEALWSDYYENVYKQYLDYLYASLENRQRPADQWPPAATKKYFRLAMIKSNTVRRGHIDDSFIQMTITGKVDDILREKYPIQLESIFKETDLQQQVSKEDVHQRKVILLEGAPGCGKSTLSVFICQQWEKGQLFNQFKLVILVRLRDPAVKNADGLADLLPCSNARTAQLLAGIMMEMKCQDVLFILDGWDELPIDLRKESIFGNLVSPILPSSHPFSKSTVIVTSRPIASGDLHKIVSSRVEILGFTAEELHHFFLECLTGGIEAVKTLLERIEENPEVAGSCYLPLNATILVHLFKNDQNTLPTTLYGIFSSLILTCIKRHLKLRTPQYKDEPMKSLDQLPEFAMKPFLVLCQFAYDGVMEDKIVFTDLPADVNTLSLLQGVESFIEREKAVSYNFIHLSIQELLAAWYIATQLSASEQVSKFNELFEKSRFNAVFRFYAAITQLRTPGIKEVVMNVVKKYRNNKHHHHQDNTVLMISLLHCLYEAQDPTLCESVAQKLQQSNGLDLKGTTVTPSDCLSTGYFLAHVCKMDGSQFKVNFQVTFDSGSSIGDQGCKYLISGLLKYLDPHSDAAVTNLLSIDLNGNDISHRGLQHLSTFLKIGCVDYLRLSNNKLVSSEGEDASRESFGKFVEQLKSNTTLRTLEMMSCGLDSQCAESLAEALATNECLEELEIGSNPLGDDGIQHLARALEVNRDLEILVLVNCGMTDVGLEHLAKALHHNDGLTELQIFGNDALTEKIVPVLIECLQNNHSLISLWLPGKFESAYYIIEKAVNDVRKKSGLPLIEVEGMSLPLKFNDNSVATSLVPSPSYTKREKGSH